MNRLLLILLSFLFLIGCDEVPPKVETVIVKKIDTLFVTNEVKKVKTVYVPIIKTNTDTFLVKTTEKVTDTVFKAQYIQLEEEKKELVFKVTDDLVGTLFVQGINCDVTVNDISLNIPKPDTVIVKSKCTFFDLIKQIFK